MADIDIEERNTVWPWIILAGVIVVILLFIFIDSTPDEPVAEDEPIETTIAADINEQDAESAVNLIEEEENLAPVIDYVTFVTENEDRMGMAHNYTHDALIKLTDAIEALANELNHDLKANLSEVRNLASDITTKPNSEQHGNKITQALRITTNALMELQQSYYPTLSEEVTGMEDDVSRLEEIVSNLNPDELTLEQKEIINSYLNKAGEVLKEMN